MQVKVVSLLTSTRERKMMEGENNKFATRESYEEGHVWNHFKLCSCAKFVNIPYVKLLKILIKKNSISTQNVYIKKKKT